MDRIQSETGFGREINMIKFMTQEEVDLIHAIIPWVSSHEEINGKMKPILKKDSPKEIVEKRDRLFELILLEAAAED